MEGPAGIMSDEKTGIRIVKQWSGGAIVAIGKRFVVVTDENDGTYSTTPPGGTGGARLSLYVGTLECVARYVFHHGRRFRSIEDAEHG